MAEHGHAPKGRLLRWLGARGGASWGTEPADYDPQAVAETLDGAGRLFGAGRYFPLAFDGWEHVPDAPAMIVMNHSGGTTIPDMWGFLAGWYRHFGTSRPIHPLGHEMLFASDEVGRYMARRGVMRASPRHCVHALRDAGRDVLIAPGGDREVWRPWAQRYDVVFDGRTGYARMALSCGVPIVPVAHVGAHHSLVVLSDGRRIARTLGLQHTFRAEVFPVHLSLPWGLAVGPWPHLPLPVTLRYRIGAPVGERATAPEVPDDEAVRRTDEAVRARIQAMLHQFRDEGHALR